MDRKILEKAWLDSYDFNNLSVEERVKKLSELPAKVLATYTYKAAMELRGEGINWYGAAFEDELIEVMEKGDVVITNSDIHITVEEYKEIIDMKNNIGDSCKTQSKRKPKTTIVQQFKDLAKQYGFKVLQDGEAYRLCAKNTDNRWTRWISYYPEKDTVSFYGNTDYLNIWLCDTRKDLTPEKCLKFVEDLNNLFELKGEDKLLIKDLIDPEDWQEIAGVHDAYEDKRYSSDKKKNISIYKIDSSKLIKIGEEGYQPGQEQAKVYFDTIPNGQFIVEITGEEPIREIASMVCCDFGTNNPISLSIDNEDAQHIGMTIYYCDIENKAPRHSIISYANCTTESNYDLANKILKYIEDSLQSQMNKTSEINQKSVDNIISYATRFFEKNNNDLGNKNNIEPEKEM